MSYAEFPHVNYEDTDFHELIALYKKVVHDYDGTLKTITELSNRLTTYENNVDSKIIQTVNNVVPSAVANAVNAFKSEIDQSLIKINERLNHLENNFATLSTTVTNNHTALSNKISTVEHNLNIAIQNCNSEINAVERRMQLMKDDLLVQINKAYVDATVHADNNDSATREYIASQIELVYKKIEEVSKENGRDMIIAMWKYCLCQYGYSAYQWYMDSSISCEDWNIISPTCIEWYTNGLNMFHWFDRRNLMFSPVSGNLVPVQEALYDLATKLKVNAITAGEYDAMQITADQFENMQMTSGEYDWAGKVLEDYYSEEN